MLGYSDGELPQAFESWEGLLHPEDKESASRYVNGFVRRLNSRDFEMQFRMRAKDGQYRWILSKGRVNERDLAGYPSVLLGTHVDITTQKNIEDALRKSEIFFRGYFNNAVIGNTIAGPDGLFLEVNKAFLDITGYQLDQIKGTPFSGLIHLIDQPEIFKLVNKIISREINSFRRETRILTIEGSTTWCDLSVSCIVDSYNRVEYLIGAITDISERRKAEHEKAIILHSMTEVVVYYDLDFKVIWASKTAGQVDLAHFERHTRNCRKTWAGQDKPCEGCPILRVRDEGKPHEAEVHTQDGKTWLVRGYPVIDDENILVGLVEFAMDITERKMAENILERAKIDLETMVHERTQDLLDANMLLTREVQDRQIAEESLLRNEMKFRNIVSNSPDGIILTDESGVLIEWNPATVEIAGIKKEDALGSYIWELMGQLSPEKKRSVAFNIAIKRFYARLLKGKLPSEQDMVTEQELLHQSGTIKVIQFKTFVIPSEKGYKIAGIMRDITRQKEAEKSVIAALEKEMELNQLRSRFVSTVSHEFRTPLASIYSNTQLLQKYQEKWDIDKKNNSFRRIYESVKLMSGMLEDVSLLGKGQSGRQKFNPGPEDIVMFCNKIMEEVTSSFNHSTSIVFESSCTDTSVLIDTMLLRHILVNLLSNAIKYSPGKDRVYFSVARDSKTGTRFTVRDEGIGIPPDDLKNIFEPFHRGTNIENIKGTGLGMSIVKQCVDIHNGRITIESQIGLGTRVVVSIPGGDTRNQ
jgi:PAS domain S-box-containing protein